MDSQLTIAIVTKKRPSRLARCLESICRQSVFPTVVFIIDNDSKKSAYPIFKKFKKKLNIKYFSEKRPGVPSARNTALKKAKTRFLGFVDDDCILDKRWVELATKELFSRKGLTYVVGNTQLYNNQNIVALAQHLRDTYWRLKSLKKDNQTMEYHFDTKNVVLKRSIILSNKVSFDTKCSIGRYDSADFDMGLQLTRKSLKGIYLKKMQLFHEDNVSLKMYIKRAYYRGRLAGYISRKWKLGHKLVDLSARNLKWWIFDTLNNFSKEKIMYTKGRNLSGLEKILITILIRIHDRAYLQGYLSFLENKRK